MASTARGGNHRNQGQSLQCTSLVESVLGEVHQNICSGSILQKTPCLEQLKLEEAEIWTRLWEEGGRMRNWPGMRQTCSWPPVKTRAFFPLSRKTHLPHGLPQTGTSCILSWFPRALPCQFQRPFLLMWKPRPDFINALPIKISRLQFKDCPD